MQPITMLYNVCYNFSEHFCEVTYEVYAIFPYAYYTYFII